MADTPAPVDPGGRPRIVVGAFYSWIAAAVLTAGLGLLMLVQPPTLIKIVGLLVILVALAQGFVADKARKRDLRYARSALALAMGTVAFLALIVLFLGPAFIVVVLIGLVVVLLITGAVLNQRPTAQAWYRLEGSA